MENNERRVSYIATFSIKEARFVHLLYMEAYFTQPAFDPYESATRVVRWLTVACTGEILTQRVSHCRLEQD